MGADGASTSRLDGGALTERSSELVVLHYPFMHFERWYVRWNILTSEGTDWGFYNESRKARRAGDSGREFYLQSVFVDRGADNQTKLEAIRAEGKARDTHARMRTPRCCANDPDGACARSFEWGKTEGNGAHPVLRLHL